MSRRTEMQWLMEDNRMDWHGRRRPTLQGLESRNSCVRLASKLDDDEDEFDTDQDEASRGLLSGIMARAIVRSIWQVGTCG